jgi:hypothetical protein
MTKPSKLNFSEWMKYKAKKRELKRALARKPKPAKVRIPDEDKPQQGKTGWPPGLLQDDSTKLSKWFTSKPDAMQRAREAGREIITQKKAPK